MASDVFQLIDLDRTLFDTRRYAQAVTDRVNVSVPGWGTKLYAQYEQAIWQEKTFYLFRLLRHEKGDAWFMDIVRQAVAAVGAENLILPGARERIAAAPALSLRRPAWGILSYGDDVDQRLKCTIIGLADAPLLLSPSPDKAQLLASWQHADGSFALPAVFGGGRVAQLTLEDDKLRAFHHLPAIGVRGYWITTDDNAANRLNQAAATENDAFLHNVTIVPGLRESCAAITRDIL